MVNKNGNKNSADVGVVNHADNDVSVLVSGVIDEMKKNMKLVKKILSAFGNKIKFVNKPYGGYLFSFVDDDGASVDFRIDYADNTYLITLPTEWRNRVEIEYCTGLINMILSMEKDEHIVLIEEKGNYKARIMTNREIVNWIEVSGFSAYKKNELIVLTKRE